jgi:hypothetical protein
MENSKEDRNGRNGSKEGWKAGRKDMKGRKDIKGKKWKEGRTEGRNVIEMRTWKEGGEEEGKEGQGKKVEKVRKKGQ